MNTTKLHIRPLIGIFLVSLASVSLAAGKPPNIVFFALDDMNDWVGALGYGQAITPNMDRLAESGVNFTNAHTAGIFCAPSQTTLFTGRHATSTGCYTTQVYFHSLPELTPLQLVLQRGGYATHGGGKLFHHPAGFVDLKGWDEFFVRDDGQKRRGWPLESWETDMAILPKPYPNSIFNHDRKPANKWFLEWGPVRDEDEDKMADTIRTEWACDLLRRKHEKPLFLAVGLFQLGEDPNEWHNLASRPEHTAVAKRLNAAAPKRFAQPLPSHNEIRLVVDGETFRWESKGKRRQSAGGASN